MTRAMHAMWYLIRGDGIPECTGVDCTLCVIDKFEEGFSVRITSCYRSSIPPVTILEFISQYRGLRPEILFLIVKVRMVRIPLILLRMNYRRLQ